MGLQAQPMSETIRHHVHLFRKFRKRSNLTLGGKRKAQSLRNLIFLNLLWILFITKQFAQLTQIKGQRMQFISLFRQLISTFLHRQLLNTINIIYLMEKSGIHKLANSTFTSQFFSSSGKADLEKSLTAIKNNRVAILHSLTPIEMIKKTDVGEKPLLLYSAFYNSPVSTLYLLQRGANLWDEDNEGKSIFHLCAYTGHVQVLKVVRNEMKLNRIRILNEKYIELLVANNYKRTDVKNGELKFSVSETRRKAFVKMQDAITALYQNYITTILQETYKSLMALVKTTNRNCFHLACLNRYQKCLNVLQYMFEQLSNFNIAIDNEAVQLYTEVGNCFDDYQRMDPRLYQDTLDLIRETVAPSKLNQINREIQRKVDASIEEIMNSKDLDGHTPLYIASKNGYTAIINLLRKWQSLTIKKSQDTQDLIKIANHNLARSHIMDLCEASKEADPKKMNFLLSCGEEINKKKTIFGTFALLQAVKSFEKERNLEPIRLLILSGADINEQDTNGWTVLHHACEKGMKEILVEIFKIWEEGKAKRIAINKMTNKNYHILHLAAMNNHPEIIEYLLTSPSAKKLEINGHAVDGDECTVLHHAARKGSLQALKKILDYNPSLIYSADIRSNTPLHYAAMNDHIPCIKYLLYFDSDYDKLQNMKNSRGKLAKDLTVNKKPFQNVITAAKEGDVNLVRKMISQNGELKNISTLEKQRNLLIVSVLNNHLLVVKYLVSIGLDLTHKDKYGKTARDYAVDQQKNCKSKQQLVLIKNILALLQK